MRSHRPCSGLVLSAYIAAYPSAVVQWHWQAGDGEDLQHTTAVNAEYGFGLISRYAGGFFLSAGVVMFFDRAMYVQPPFPLLT